MLLQVPVAAWILGDPVAIGQDGEPGITEVQWMQSRVPRKLQADGRLLLNRHV